eukprot:g3206.t1
MLAEMPTHNFNTGRADFDITLVDTVEGNPDHLSSLCVRPGRRITTSTVDITDEAAVHDLLAVSPGGNGPISVYHLAAINSGMGETHYDLAVDVNLRGSMYIAAALRKAGETLGGGPMKLVVSSTFATYGGVAEVHDSSPNFPRSTYGTTKAMTDLLLSDMSRKGLVDCRIGRIAAVIGRPEPSSAASNVFTAIFREPLNGEDLVIPVPLDTEHVFTTCSNIARQLISLHEAEAASLLEEEHRVVVLPAEQATLRSMYESAKKIGSELGVDVGAVTVEEDPVVTAVVQSWCQSVRYDKAARLGLPFEFVMDDVIRQFAEENVNGQEKG